MKFLLKVNEDKDMIISGDFEDEILCDKSNIYKVWDSLRRVPEFKFVSGSSNIMSNIFNKCSYSFIRGTEYNRYESGVSKAISNNSISLIWSRSNKLDTVVFDLNNMTEEEKVNDFMVSTDVVSGEEIRFNIYDLIKQLNVLGYGKGQALSLSKINWRWGSIKWYLDNNNILIVTTDYWLIPHKYYEWYDGG